MVAMLSPSSRAGDTCLLRSEAMGGLRRPLPLPATMAGPASVFVQSFVQFRVRFWVRSKKEEMSCIRQLDICCTCCTCRTRCFTRRTSDVDGVEEKGGGGLGALRATRDERIHGVRNDDGASGVSNIKLETPPLKTAHRFTAAERGG